MPFGINKLTGRPGPAPKPPESGNKRQARQRVNVEVRTGRRPHPNLLPCVDCGRVYEPGGIRHEYDHYLGYEAEHHYEVESVCSACHSKRHERTECKRGHKLEGGNAGVTAEGRRFCRECRRLRERNRGRDAAYWREYRRKRLQAKKGGVGHGS